MGSIIPFILMGFTAMLLQITVLRLLLSTFSGNELDIGLTLSFWLIYVGLGSFTGKKVKLKHAFIYSFVLIALLAQPTAMAIKAIRLALHLEPGEAVSFASTTLSTAICLFPTCFIIGLQFPLAVLYSGSANAAGRVYGLEAVGAFIGGVLFTFVISSRVGVMELCLLLSLFNILMASYLSRQKVIVSLFIIPLLLYLGLYKIAPSLPWQGMELSRAVESKYGEIAVIKIGRQSSIYANGHLVFTYPDVPDEELRAHLPMALRPLSSRILIIGGSPGILKEFMKYPVRGIDFVELDPKIVEVSFRLLGPDDRDAVKDRRVRIIIEDGRRFIKRFKNPTYDLIVLNLPQPSTAGINRYYTFDFFTEAKRALNADGMLVLSISQSTGYIGRSMQTTNGSIYNSLKSAFRYVGVTAQEYGSIFASESLINTDPEILGNRFVSAGTNTKYFNQYIFRDAFSQFNVDYVKKRIGDIKIMNTDLQPSAYLYNLMLWSEIHGGKVLRYMLRIKGWHVGFVLVIAFVFVILFTFRKIKRAVYYSSFTTGFSGMTFMLAVILAYQAMYGYVYEMIGILSATFMIGLWAGTSLSSHTKNALRILFYLEVMTATLALAAPLFFREELLFYLLILLSGIITGAQFSTANLSLGELGAAGRLYGLDLIGSFLGALIPSIILIPLFGVVNTLLSIVAVKMLSAVMILSTVPSLARRG